MNKLFCSANDINIRLESAGIQRVILPLKSLNTALNHVNGWLLHGEEACQIIDTGIDNPATRQVWQRVLQENNAPRVSDLFCTHAHLDHAGLARFFATEFGANVHITAGEWAYWQARYQDNDQAGDKWLEILQHGGFPPEPSRLSNPVPTPPEYHLALEQGTLVAFGGREWHVHTGGGHSPQAACFIDTSGGFAFLGDQILPEMTPFVGIETHAPDGDPLADHLACLQQLSGLDETIMGLPGHGAPFYDISARAKTHIRSYEARLTRALEAAKNPARCKELLPALFRTEPEGAIRDILIITAMALFNHLIQRGQMRRWLETDGAYRYQAI